MLSVDVALDRSAAQLTGQTARTTRERLLSDGPRFHLPAPGPLAQCERINASHNTALRGPGSRTSGHATDVRVRDFQSGTSARRRPALAINRFNAARSVLGTVPNSDLCHGVGDLARGVKA
jgi:hypothetical protein